MQYATVEKNENLLRTKVHNNNKQEISSVVLLSYQAVLVFQIIDANLIALMDTGGSQEIMISLTFKN